MSWGSDRDANDGGAAGNGRSQDAGRGSHFARVDPTIGAIVGNEDGFSIAEEHYRNLAFRVEEEAHEAAQKGFVITVTSAEPSTGKTLICLNLALTLARGSEERILLAEVDLRRPALEGYLQTFLVAASDQQQSLLRSETPPLGLWQVLEKGIALREVVLPLWGTRLDLLLAGTDGRAETVTARDRMSELLATLRSRYPIVILDSPPLILADGRAAAARADRTLVVVRAGRTKRKQIESALALVDPRRTLGLILNATKPRPETPYSHYRRATNRPPATPEHTDALAAGPRPVAMPPETDAS